MSKLRTDHQLRLDSCDKSLAKRVREYFTACNELHALRDKLKYPSDRLAMVEKFYGMKLADLKGGDRELAEAVAVEHDLNRVIYFAESRIGGRIEALDCGPMLREFHASFARQIEKEIEAVRDYLFVVYDAAGLAHEVEAAAPLVRLHDLLRRAREHAEGTAGPAAHAMESTFRFITDEP